MDAVRRVSRSPERNIVFTHLTIQAPLIGANCVHTVPCSKEIHGRDVSGIRNAGQIQTVLPFGESDCSDRKPSGDDAPMTDIELYAKSTNLLNGISRKR